MRIFILLEYGIPHYREFIFNWLLKSSCKFKIIHSGERFSSSGSFPSTKGTNIKLFSGISICLFNFFEIRKYNIIISTLNYRKPHTWLPWLFYRSKKWIFWGQGPGSSKNKFLSSLKRYIINNSEGYIVYTPKGEKELLQIGVAREKISIAYNTLKINNAGLTTGDSYLLYVGRIQKRKGLDKILKAIEGKRYKLVLVGNESDYKSELKKLVIMLGLEDQVVFKNGIYNDNELKPIFSNAIAYISPDHVGLGVVHAFAYGVPVITNREKSHAPEFYYCNKDNSYLYENDFELPLIIDNVFNNKEVNSKKRKNAFKYYKENLDYNNVLKAFEVHLTKIQS